MPLEIAPYIPPIDPQNASDTQNFDETFLDMEPVIQDEQELAEESDRSGDRTDTDKTDGEDSVQTPAQSRSPSIQPMVQDGVDLFDGYSFKGRHSVLIDEEDEEAEIEEENGEEGEEEGEADHLVDDAQASNGVVSIPSTMADEIEEVIPKTPEARKPSLHELSQTPYIAVEPSHQRSLWRLLSKMFCRWFLRRRQMELLLRSKLRRRWTRTFLTRRLRTPHQRNATLAALANRLLWRKLRRRHLLFTKDECCDATTWSARKSGIAALDKYLSDGADEDVEPDDDDDWDLVEAPGGEDRNGSKGTSLFRSWCRRSLPPRRLPQGFHSWEKHYSKELLWHVKSL